MSILVLFKQNCSHRVSKCENLRIRTTGDLGVGGDEALSKGLGDIANKGLRHKATDAQYLDARPI
jgi:hypothetical protein